MVTTRLVLLVVGVVGVLARPRRWRVWTVPAAAVAVGVATGALGPGAVRAAVRPLAAPLAFLLLAVPLAVLLDEAGFFAAVADRIDAGRRLPLALWGFAAMGVLVATNALVGS